jgi:hypothetical protein
MYSRAHGDYLAPGLNALHLFPTHISPAQGEAAWVDRTESLLTRKQRPGAADRRRHTSRGAESGSDMFLYWILLTIVWIAIAFWPARVAARKGHSFLGFFLFSLVFFPAALITAYVVTDRRATVGI